MAETREWRRIDNVIYEGARPICTLDKYVVKDGRADEAANLICSVHDLLAACESFIDWLDNADAPKSGSLKIPGDKARAAIAKARAK